MSDVPQSRDRDDEETHGGFTLETYAEICAVVRAEGDLEGLLERRGFTLDEWRIARKEWTRAIDDEMARGEDRLVVAFARELEQARAALVEAAAARTAEAPAAPVQVPTFLREKERPVPSFLQAASQVLLGSRAPEPPASPPADVEERTAYARLDPTSSTPLPFAEKAEGAPAFEPPPRPPDSNPEAAPGATQAIRVPKGPVTAPTLTLEQYVSLVVELDLEPQARAATLARYFVRDEDAFAALEQAYLRRFGAEPGLAARFGELAKQYRDWKRGR